MRTELLVAATLLALSGCAPGVPTAAAPSASDSLPFRTVVADFSSPGAYLDAGADDRVVLRAAADLDALVARHGQRSFPGPRPLPEKLTGLDWGKWQAIALFEGRGDRSIMARITGIVDLGDRLEVRSTRWATPPSIPADAGVLHVVAIPRTDKPVVFAATTEQAADPATGPRWKAVQNPLQTRDLVNMVWRAALDNGQVETSSLERRTLAWIHDNVTTDPAIYGPYTPDSEVWLGVTPRRIAIYAIEGDSPYLYYQAAKN